METGSQSAPCGSREDDRRRSAGEQPVRRASVLLSRRDAALTDPMAASWPAVGGE